MPLQHVSVIDNKEVLMSRWNEQYKTHQYKQDWEALKNVLAETELDDESIQDAVDELARLRKCVKFLDEILMRVDPELIPLATWAQFQKQCKPAVEQLLQFQSTRDLTNIQSANNNLDNLLTYLRPYVVYSGDAAEALRKAILEVAQKTCDDLAEVKKKVLLVAEEIDAAKNDSNANKEEVLSAKNEVQSLLVELFGGEDDGGSKEKISLLVEDFEKKYEDILSCHKDIMVGDEAAPAIKQEISSARQVVVKIQEEVKNFRDSSEEIIQNLDTFHSKVFGDKDCDGSEIGLKQELETRLQDLDKFKGTQETRYRTLNEQIESLLPGATSAGLASAYREMKLSFDNPISSATRLFYICIGLLVLSSALLSIESIGGETWVSFVDLGSWDSIVKHLAHILPLYFPVFWLAIYASKRRSEAQRLQQEYAHKEALAKSYNSYKQQIEGLSGEDGDMLKSLIMKAIDAIAYNASETLDKRHGDKSPVQEMLEKVTRK